MKKSILFILLGAVALGSCKKYVKEDELENDLNKEAVVNFPVVQGLAYTGPNYVTYPEFSYLIDFDKRDYPKFDSITFNATMSVNPIQNAYTTYNLRIFNVTDSIEISNSELSLAGSQYTAKQLHTNNIIASLPEKKITIAIQGKGGNGAIYGAFLKLRRK
jgi:hypothetical protein